MHLERLNLDLMLVPDSYQYFEVLPKKLAFVVYLVHFVAQAETFAVPFELVVVLFGPFVVPSVLSVIRLVLCCSSASPVDLCYIYNLI